MDRHTSHTRQAPFRPGIVGGRHAGPIAALVGLLLLLTAAPALADYVVERGDVVEITVPAAPGLHRRVPVDASGRLSLPLLGDIDAAGLSLSQLRTKLRDVLIDKNIVRNPDVMVDVAEYRPVYVSGDVVKPGAYPYRPAMTVRDAAALAEGYDVLRLRGRDVMLEAANARGDYESFAVELAKQSARVGLLKAELAGRKDLDPAAIGDIPVKPSVWAEITQFEGQQLAADRDDGDREKAYLARMVNATQEQLTALTSERESAAQALDQQNRYLARARELMQRGLLQAVRIEDNQRAAAAAQAQLYEVQARAAQARKDFEDYTRKMQTVDDQRRIKLLQELRDAVAQVATARYRLQAAADKIQYTAGAQRRLASSAPAEPPEVAIFREVSGVRTRIKAEEGTLLQPGDNVEITTKSELGKLVTGLSSEDRPAVPGVPAAAPERR